jgi:hypothetical protein
MFREPTVSGSDRSSTVYDGFSQDDLQRRLNDIVCRHSVDDPPKSGLTYGIVLVAHPVTVRAIGKLFGRRISGLHRAIAIGAGVCILPLQHDCS